MALVSYHNSYQIDDYTRFLQNEATSDIMNLIPGQKRHGLDSYGLPRRCRILANTVLMGMNWHLLRWAHSAEVILPDLEKPYFRPEAFRLDKDCAVWPTLRDVGILVPLGGAPASIELLPRGTNWAVPTLWQPGMVLFLNEVGMRFTGNGSLHFIYIAIHKARLLEFLS